MSRERPAAGQNKAAKFICLPPPCRQFQRGIEFRDKAVGGAIGRSAERHAARIREPEQHAQTVLPSAGQGNRENAGGRRNKRACRGYPYDRFDVYQGTCGARRCPSSSHKAGIILPRSTPTAPSRGTRARRSRGICPAAFGRMGAVLTPALVFTVVGGRQCPCGFRARVPQVRKLSLRSGVWIPESSGSSLESEDWFLGTVNST
jgi:hypothetical protein